MSDLIHIEFIVRAVIDGIQRTNGNPLFDITGAKYIAPTDVQVLQRSW